MPCKYCENRLLGLCCSACLESFSNIYRSFGSCESLIRVKYTPYSKMAENTLFFCLHVNWPLLPRFKPNIPLNFADGIEATRANKQ